MHYLRELLYNRSVINNIHTDKYICIILKEEVYNDGLI
mgnify:CR=1 FL=1